MGAYPWTSATLKNTFVERSAWIAVQMHQDAAPESASAIGDRRRAHNPFQPITL